MAYDRHTYCLKIAKDLAIWGRSGQLLVAELEELKAILLELRPVLVQLQREPTSPCDMEPLRLLVDSYQGDRKVDR